MDFILIGKDEKDGGDGIAWVTKIWVKIHQN